MAKALGIVSSARNRYYVEGMNDYRPIGAFSFLGRYRIIDFPISNLSNSGIQNIQVYVDKNPRSLTEHVGTSGRHYNINSKRGSLKILYSDISVKSDIYKIDITSYLFNLEQIQKSKFPYVVIVPSYMVYTQDFDALLQQHIDSEADITMLYHSVDNAKNAFLNCDVLTLNKDKKILSIDKNRGTTKHQHVFMDTYIMKKDLFIELITEGKKISSMYTLAHVVNAKAEELKIQGVAHKGYFASCTDFNDYYEANMSLVDYKNASELFKEEWPIYTRTNDSAPTHYFKGADVRESVISNGCQIEGTVYNSIIGRGCTIQKGAVIKNSIVLPDVIIGENVHVENMVVDKHASVTKAKEVIAPANKPGYVLRGDIL
ncbi:MAG: glucose-1-phosphate adenylyltransferase subunit GlgD [Schaedlerella sp.]|nr:glucose-1-phosphate adenylyltransferase subunit GlgD [Schaedlerella sp.]